MGSTFSRNFLQYIMLLLQLQRQTINDVYYKVTCGKVVGIDIKTPSQKRQCNNELLYPILTAVGCC